MEPPAKKPKPIIGGLGMGIFLLFALIGLCTRQWIFGVLAIIGLGMVIYALFTGNMKFLG